MRLEEIERGRRHVFDAGIFGEDGAIAEEHPGYEVRVDAVIAAPGFQIVGEDGLVPTLPTAASQEAR